MAAGERLNPVKCNIVQQEQIWYYNSHYIIYSIVLTCLCRYYRKDYVYHEGKAVKRWAATWGFLQKEYQNVSS